MSAIKKTLFTVGAFFALPLFRLYWFIFRPESAGVKCVIRYRDQVLLIRNSYGLKLWTLPGGGVNRGETLEDAAKREVMEEVGIAIQHAKPCGSIFYDGEYKRNTIWVFLAEVASPEFQIDDWEIEEARWFSKSLLPERRSHLLDSFLALTDK